MPWPGRMWLTTASGCWPTLSLAIADGATSISDIDMPGDQRRIFGPVASTSTTWRAFNEIDERALKKIALARNRIRKRVWSLIEARHGSIPPTRTAYGDIAGMIGIRIDATLVNSYSDKQCAAGNFKGGSGIHPLTAWCDTTGERLALVPLLRQRRSNTAANPSRQAPSCCCSNSSAATATSRWPPPPRRPRCRRTADSAIPVAAHRPDHQTIPQDHPPDIPNMAKANQTGNSIPSRLRHPLTPGHRVRSTPRSRASPGQWNAASPRTTCGHPPSTTPKSPDQSHPDRILSPRPRPVNYRSTGRFTVIT